MVKVRILSGDDEHAVEEATNAFFGELIASGIMYDIRETVPFVSERTGKFYVLVQYWQGAHLR